MTDIETARQIAAGNPEILEVFVREHYTSVLRFMRHITRRVEDAEDLTQQTFLKARLQAGSFRGRSSLRTWLHRVAFHEYTHWKRAQRKTESLRPSMCIVEPGYAAYLEAENLLDALHRLPAAHRETFLLHEIQELSVQEVAQVLGKPVGTVKSRLFQSRKLLRSLLEGGQEDRLNGEPAHESL